MKKTIKICFCSVIMGVVLFLSQEALNLGFGNWLHLTIFPKILLFSFVCILGFVTFVFCAKFSGVLDIKEVVSNLIKKRKNNA